jgi:G3E family GTPase
MKIKIDIFSGFFGAGKTSLIKKLINENIYTKKVIVVENDFGDIGIDGIFLKKYNINVREINGGCICCSTLNGFKDTLQEIIGSDNVENIIIEPSGVGKLSEIIKIVEKLELQNDVFLSRVITVVDVTMYEDSIDYFAEFYKDQIIYANTIVLSRTQNVNYEELQSVVSKIKNLNKKANIITTPWDNLSGSIIIGASDYDGRQDLFKKANIIKMPPKKLKLKIIRKNLAEDVFSSWGIQTPKVFSIETLKSILNSLKNEELYGKVLRSKGIVQVDENHWIEFDFVPKQFEIRDTQPDYTGRICVIGVNLNKENLINLWGN